MMKFALVNGSSSSLAEVFVTTVNSLKSLFDKQFETTSGCKPMEIANKFPPQILQLHNIADANSANNLPV
jgi:hypothetical protein